MSNMGRDKLIQCLDTAVLAYILVVFTLDQTAFRAILAYIFHHEISKPVRDQRSIAQRISTRNALVCITVNQLVAILMHSLGSTSEVAADGYLHGSLFTNFIGVLPPSKAKLIMGDVVVVLLELMVFIVARDPEYSPSSPANILEPSPSIESISLPTQDIISPKRAFEAVIEPIPIVSQPPQPSEPGQTRDPESQAEEAPDNIVAYLRAMSGVSW